MNNLLQQAALLGAGYFCLLAIWRALGTYVPNVRRLAEYPLFAAVAYLSWRTVGLLVDNQKDAPVLAGVVLLSAVTPALVWSALSRMRAMASKAPTGVKSASQMARLIKGAGSTSLLKLGTVPWPVEAETAHLLLLGDRGGSREALLTVLVEQLLARGDKVVVLDRNGALLSRFYRAGRDHVFHPADQRSKPWALHNELQGAWDAASLARALVPDGAHEDRDVVGAAQGFVSALARKLFDTHRLTPRALQELVMEAGLDVLEPLLKGTSGMQVLDSPRLLSETRSLLEPLMNLLAQTASAPDGFSFREFMTSEGPSATFVPYRDAALVESRDWLGAVTDTALRAALGLEPDPARRVWVIAPNLEDVARVQSLESALPRGKKVGLGVVAGVAASEVVPAVYETPAESFLAGFGTWVIGTSSDAATASLAAHALSKEGNTVSAAQVGSLKPCKGFALVHGGYPACDVAWPALKGDKGAVAAFEQTKAPVADILVQAPEPEPVVEEPANEVEQAPAPAAMSLSARMGFRSSSTFRVPELSAPEEEHVALHVDEPGRTREAVSKVVTREERGAMYSKWEPPKPAQDAVEVPAEAPPAPPAVPDVVAATPEALVVPEVVAAVDLPVAPPGPPAPVRRPRSAVFTKALVRDEAPVEQVPHASVPQGALPAASEPLTTPARPLDPLPVVPAPSASHSGPLEDAPAEAAPQGSASLKVEALSERASKPGLETPAHDPATRADVPVARFTPATQPVATESNARGVHVVPPTAVANAAFPEQLELPSSRRRGSRPVDAKLARSGSGVSAGGRGNRRGSGGGRDLLKLLG